MTREAVVDSREKNTSGRPAEPKAEAERKAITQPRRLLRD
jgi:hypothetical protein